MCRIQHCWVEPIEDQPDEQKASKSIHSFWAFRPVRQTAPGFRKVGTPLISTPGGSGSQVARGEGRDRLRAIDARDHTWVSSSGHVKDTSYFAETTSSCVALALVLKSCRSHDIPSQAGG